MFDKKPKTKIKNETTQLYRNELFNFPYNVAYHPGRENYLSGFLRSISPPTKKEHESLCYSGATTMSHFVSL